MIAMKASDIAEAVGANKGTALQCGTGFPACHTQEMTDWKVGPTNEAPTDEIIVRRVSTDSRDILPGDLFVAIRGPNHNGHDHIDEAAAKGAVACICDQAWFASHQPNDPSIVLVVVDDTIAALGRLAGHYRRKVMGISTVVVAVTGSNGKTTTKCMIDHVLGRRLPGKASPKSYNNHIGLPLTLLAVDANDKYVVAEIGTNSPGEIAALAEIAGPDVGVITSIGEAHLEKLGGVEGVAAEKATLLDKVRPGGLCVVNVDGAEIRAHLPRVRYSRLVTVGITPEAKLQVTHRCSTIRGTTFELDGRFRLELPMPGGHHATNAAATFAVARWFGLEPNEIIEAFKTFVPPEGRTRTIDVGGVTIVDDAYNANPGSVGAAIKALQNPGPRRRIFVLGDMLELGEAAVDCHERVMREIAASTIDILVTVGPQTLRAIDAVREQFNSATAVYACGDVAAACGVLDSIAVVGDTVWVKASRAMGLDRVVHHLQSRWSPKIAAVA